MLCRGLLDCGDAGLGKRKGKAGSFGLKLISWSGLLLFYDFAANLCRSIAAFFSPNKRICFRRAFDHLDHP